MIIIIFSDSRQYHNASDSSLSEIKQSILYHDLIMNRLSWNRDLYRHASEFVTFLWMKVRLQKVIGRDKFFFFNIMSSLSLQRARSKQGKSLHFRSARRLWWYFSHMWVEDVHSEVDWNFFKFDIIDHHHRSVNCDDDVYRKHIPMSTWMNIEDIWYHPFILWSMRSRIHWYFRSVTTCRQLHAYIVFLSWLRYDDDL